MKTLFYFVLLTCSFSSMAFTKEKALSPLESYSNALKKTRSSKKVSIEQTYIQGLIAMNSLEESLGRNENEIDAKWLKSMREKMQGFTLSPNTETFVEQVQYDFFLDLAKKNGVDADVAFFELTKKTFPRANWPLYIEQRTDVQGCTIYDGSLTKLHHDWSDFHHKYPKAYTKIVDGQIANIEQELTESNCSCSDKAEPILKELQDFLQANPKSSLSSKIQKRMKEIQTKKAPIPGCVSAN